jgi:NAD(P)-dependent dehydrogenase (short-subunit alcohol dehydrogenase family)
MEERIMAYELTLGGPGAALVLGGSGGVGSAICRALGRAGSDVALSYNSNTAKAHSVVDEVQALGRAASRWQIDLTQTAETAKAIAAISERHGGIHTLVYAVGPIFTWASIGDIPPPEFHSVLAVETAGFHAALHAALPHLRRARGSIVACTTWANRRMMSGDGLSAVPKAAIDSMVRQVACEEGRNLVRANIVSVGSVDIGMGSAANERSMAKDITPEQWTEMLCQIPLGERLGSGEELASAVVYLASDQASYVTGQTIIVDGGLSL